MPEPLIIKVPCIFESDIQGVFFIYHRELYEQGINITYDSQSTDMYIEHCSMNSVHCTLGNVQYTLHTV